MIAGHGALPQLGELVERSRMERRKGGRKVEEMKLCRRVNGERIERNNLCIIVCWSRRRGKSGSKKSGDGCSC
jgi:hypothetical protein